MDIYMIMTILINGWVAVQKRPVTVIERKMSAGMVLFKYSTRSGYYLVLNGKTHFPKPEKFFLHQLEEAKKWANVKLTAEGFFLGQKKNTANNISSVTPTEDVPKEDTTMPINNNTVVIEGLLAAIEYAKKTGFSGKLPRVEGTTTYEFPAPADVPVTSDPMVEIESFTENASGRALCTKCTPFGSKSPVYHKVQDLRVCHGKPVAPSRESAWERSQVFTDRREAVEFQIKMKKGTVKPEKDGFVVVWTKG